jgi:hypothetical protein
MIRHAREGNAGGARGPGGPAEETYVDMVVERREITALNVLCFVKQGGTEEMVRRKVVCERLMKMEAVGLETGGKLFCRLYSEVPAGEVEGWTGFKRRLGM